MLHSFVFVTLQVKLGSTLYALAVFFILIKLKDYVLEKVWGLEGLACMDYIFLHDEKRSRGNILGRFILFIIDRCLHHGQIQDRESPQVIQREEQGLPSDETEADKTHGILLLGDHPRPGVPATRKPVVH